LNPRIPQILTDLHKQKKKRKKYSNRELHEKNKNGSEHKQKQ